MPEDIVSVIRNRLKNAPPGLYFVPNRDVQLLLAEIDKSRMRESDETLPRSSPDAGQ